jgi:hypothetical protein
MSSNLKVFMFSDPHVSEDKSCGDARAVARKSRGVFRLQPLAAIAIPTSICMNIVAAVPTGDLGDGIMIGEGFLLTVPEIKFDPAAISSPVFRFPRAANASQTICPKEKFLVFHVRHFSPLPRQVSNFPRVFR